MSVNQIVREFDLADNKVLYRWIKQYKETGTIVETRGRGNKLEIPNKGRPRKTPEKTLEEMTKEELIQFLKENLRVEVKHVRPSIDSRAYLKVELYLGDECISSDYEY